MEIANLVGQSLFHPDSVDVRIASREAVRAALQAEDLAEQAREPA